MKQMADPQQMTSLSSVAKDRLYKWCKEKGYGTQFEDGYVPMTQLTIPAMIEYLGNDLHALQNCGEHWDVVTMQEKQYEGGLCDALFSAVKDILEEKD